jgi:F0F1-type ATP synthase assembly protein I
MEELSTEMNWLGVVAGTIVGFLIGWLWYSPILFGRKWAEGSGVELGTASSMPIAAMATQLISTFLLAIVIGITASQNALTTAILILVTLAGFVMSMGLFVKKSTYAVAVDGSFIVVMGIVMIIIQAIL